jgi:hypothetical protein
MDPPLPVLAATVNKCGAITTNETWTSGNVYVMTCSVTVNTGVALTLQAGTIVKSNGYNLYVEGTLDLQGIAGNPVVFTSYYDDAYGGNTDGTSTPPAPGQWGAIYLYNGSTTFDYALVRYSSNGVHVYNSSGSPIAPTIANSTFSNNLNGVYLEAYNRAITSSIQNNTFSNNQYGLRTHGYYSCSTPALVGNTFTGHSEFPISLTNGLPSYSGNTFSGNAHPAIAVNGEFRCSGSWPIISNMPYVLTSGTFIYSGYTLTLPAGLVVKSNGYNLYVDGTLDLQGIAGNPVVFTSYYDDAYGGNTDGTSTPPTPGQWGAIYLSNGANTLDYSLNALAGIFCFVQSTRRDDNDPPSRSLNALACIFCFV